MILVRYLSRSHDGLWPSTIALASPKDVFRLVNLLDANEKVIGWQVVEHANLNHSFGWAKEGWNKHRPNGFTREDYSE
jgi:hypothetical protein